MTYSSELTKTRIIESAIIEFEKDGFDKANLRVIAKTAHVTTGAIYNHFGSKDNLFNEIVGEVANGLLALYEKSHEDMKGTPMSDMNDSFNETTGLILEYFYDNWVVIKMLFNSSMGSIYENFSEKMIEIEEKSTLYALEHQGVIVDKTIAFFIHVISSAGVEQLIEVVAHELEKEEAFKYMRTMQDFYSHGFEKLF